MKKSRTPDETSIQPTTALRYVLYRDGDGDYRWRLKAGNNRTIGVSGEGYQNRKDCLAAIELEKGSRAAPVKRA